MSWLYRSLIRPALFEFDSERIHDFTLRALGWLGSHPGLLNVLSACSAPALPIHLFGLHFPNPIGLAAGMDKRAVALPVWERLGFGFTELGGVTWQAQPGNPPPRMFRIVDDTALINRMGFNNDGAEATAARLAQWKESGLWPKHPVAINLGKSKITPLPEAAEEFARSFRVLKPFGDFFVVNVSSPNTPNLRALQDRSALDEILAALQEANQISSDGVGAARPVLVKIAPDLSLAAIDDLLELIQQRRVAGIVATNTTVKRPIVTATSAALLYGENGGLSGRPLRDLSTGVIRHISQQTNRMLPIIGVGGVFNAADAMAKILAGASLVQIYTGLVYEGPGLAKSIVLGLQQELARRGFSDIPSAIGAGVSHNSR